VTLQVFDGEVHGFHAFFWSIGRYRIQREVLHWLQQS